MRKDWSWSAIAVGVCAILALGACADDDDDTSGSTTGTSAEAPADESDGNVAAFCDALVDADAGAAELAAAVKAAPEAISADVKAMAAEDGRATIEAGMTGVPSSDEFFAARTAVGDYMADNCGYQVVDVTATDDGFEGIPADAEAGKTLLRFTNDGSEYHEVALQEVLGGETRSVEEILTLPEEEGGALLDYRGGAFAAPGRGSWTVVDLSDGRYAALCYVATGATPESVDSGQFDDTAPSHAMKGMVAEMQVS